MNLDLETSKLISELVGEYETEKKAPLMACDCGEPDLCKYADEIGDTVPLPNFGEVIRILPKIGEKKGIRNYGGPKHINLLHHHGWWLTKLYMNATTPEQGMKEVGTYLRTLLK